MSVIHLSVVGRGGAAGSFAWIKTRRLRANLRARKAVAAYPTAVDSRSDNIAALAPNLAALGPYLK